MTTDIIGFVGVYDADSTVVGELSYWIGARFGRRHCSLCELTHGLFTMKGEWKECAANLGVPFVTHHRNDAPDDVLAVAAGSFPVVMARTTRGLEVVLDRDALEEFAGSTAGFVTWLEQRTRSEDGDVSIDRR